MTAAVDVGAGISEARAMAVQAAAMSILDGLQALENAGGRYVDDTILTLTVRWFVGKLRLDAEACLRASDQCEPEPGVQS